MSTVSRAGARLERFAVAFRCGVLRLIYGKGWACADYKRRHTPLAGPRPDAQLH
jgi:hypothetical protein